ncbi:GNAT family N-acetyltransferase [Pseudomonas trivialis]|uniref:GNAT family acetyltransferase n=1 Tax=Pseudomonas trivialis TaxID=200450 RepID=A0A0H5AJM8_9PSED|nr:N-acetyltransferase [Pseudomonas trivialis]AKS09910.1 GNAT family acetyltransferase [Pseudomonas trivialis]
MLNIREATEADLDSLQQVGCETYRQHFSTIWSPAGLQAFLDRDFSHGALRESLDLSDSHLWLLACDEHARVVGFAKVNWSAPAPLTGAIGAELRKIYFLKSAAGLGYGKQLMQYIRDLAVQRGESLLWLTVLKSNPSARRFYEAFGFQLIGEIPFNTDLAEIGMNAMGFELTQLED